MERRDFVTLIGGAAAWPLAARAQQSERPRRIGVLTAMSETDPGLPPSMAAFLQGLQALGWVEGLNVSIAYRHVTSHTERLKSAAQELVASAPELIVVWSNPAVMALRNVDRSQKAVREIMVFLHSAGFDRRYRFGARREGCDPEHSGRIHDR